MNISARLLEAMLRVALFFFLVFLSIASVCSHFFFTQSWDWTLLYYYGFLGTALFFAFRNLPDPSLLIASIKFTLDKRRQEFLLDLGLALGVFFLAIGIRLYWVNFNSVWVDEIYQQIPYVFSLQPQNILREAALQQQPPIDYYLSYFSWNFYPTTPLGLRFHALFFSSLMVMSTYLIVRHYGRSRLIGVMAAFVVCLNPLHVFLGTEARPQSLATMLITVMLFFLLYFIRTKSKRAWGYTVLCGSLSCLSIGLQPLIAIFVLFLALISEALVRRHYRVAWRVLCAGASIAVIIMPSLYVIVSSSSEMNKFNDSPVANLLREISAFSFDSFLNLFSIWGDKLHPNYSFGLLLFLIVFPVVVYVLFNRLRRKLQQNKITNSHLISGPIFLFGFPLVFFFLYKAFVGWPIAERYTAIMIPIAVVLIFITFSSALQSLGRRGAYALLPLILIGGIYFAPTILQVSSRKVIESQSGRVDWREFVKHINSWEGKTIVQVAATYPTGSVTEVPFPAIQYYAGDPKTWRFEILSSGYDYVDWKEYGILAKWKPELRWDDSKIQNRVLLFYQMGFIPKRENFNSAVFSEIHFGEAFALAKIDESALTGDKNIALAKELIRLVPSQSSDARSLQLIYLLETMIEKEDTLAIQSVIESLKEISSNQGQTEFANQRVVRNLLNQYIRSRERMLASE